MQQASWIGGRRPGRAPSAFRPGNAGVVILALLSVEVLSLTTSGDYGATQAVSGDNAAPAIEALLHGDVAGYFARQPLIGLTTILLRLPFAALAHALGGDDLLVYKLGAVACLLPLAFGAGWLLAESSGVTRVRLMRVITVGLVVVSPLLRKTLVMGHPEDVAAATLATASVVLAMRGHTGWCAVALGLAIGAKEWALIAVLPVMLAVSGRRIRAGLVAAGLVVVLVGLPWLADPSAVGRAVDAQRTDFLGPLSPLWPFGGPIRMLGGGYLDTARFIPGGLGRTGAAALVLAVAALLGGVWYASLLRRRMRLSPLCLLAALAALRCIGDTAGQEYYWLTPLIAIAGWEAIEARPPVATLGVTSAVWVLYSAVGHLPSNLLYVSAIVAEAALITYLGRQGARQARDNVDLTAAPGVGIA
jgi:hypothetical protein